MFVAVAFLSVAFAGLLLAVLSVNGHPAMAIRPVLNHIGFGCRWSASDEEILGELQDVTITWGMANWRDPRSLWERLVNFFSEDRVDPRPESLRFKNDIKVVFARLSGPEESTEGTAFDERVTLRVNLPPQMNPSRVKFEIHYMDSKYTDLRVVRAQRVRASDLARVEQIYSRSEFPLVLRAYPARRAIIARS